MLASVCGAYSRNIQSELSCHLDCQPSLQLLVTLAPAIFSTQHLFSFFKVTHSTPHPRNLSPSFVLWTLATNLKTTPCPQLFQTELW